MWKLKTVVTAVFIVIGSNALAISSTNNGINITPSTNALRPYIGSVPVAFIGNTATFSCPVQSTSLLPLVTAQAGNYIYYDLTQTGTIPMFSVCSISIKYWPNESISTVAQNQYGIPSYPAAAGSCGGFGSGYNSFTCQMYPIMPPNTSVCFDDTSWSSTYNSVSGNVCVNNGKDKIAWAYGAPNTSDGKAGLGYGSNWQGVPRCSSGSLQFYVPYVTGTAINYIFAYPVQISLNVNSCAGTTFGQPWICGGTGAPCPSSFGVSLQAGMVNKISVIAPTPPTSFAPSGTWNGSAVMVIQSSVSGKF